MKRKVRPEEKAKLIFSSVRDSLPRPTEAKEFTIEGAKEINMICAKTAIIIVDHIISEVYWWQFKRKIFYMAVKMELMALRWAIINNRSFNI